MHFVWKIAVSNICFFYLLTFPYKGLYNLGDCTYCDSIYKLLLQKNIRYTYASLLFKFCGELKYIYILHCFNAKTTKQLTKTVMQ